jgi:hypothetical protein
MTTAFLFDLFPVYSFTSYSPLDPSLTVLISVFNKLHKWVLKVRDCPTSSPTILFLRAKTPTLQLGQTIILIRLVLVQKILSPTLLSPMKLGQTTKATEIRLSFRNSPRDRPLRFVCVPRFNTRPPSSSSHDKLPVSYLPFLRNREYQLTSCSLARLLRFSGPRNHSSRS